MNLNNFKLKKMAIEIQRRIDELSFEKWTFTFLSGNIYLNSYCLLKKQSKRHRNYEVLKKYNRIIGRDNTLKENDVPIPDDIKKEAFDIFTSDIKVLKWSER